MANTKFFYIFMFLIALIGGCVAGQVDTAGNGSGEQFTCFADADLDGFRNPNIVSTTSKPCSLRTDGEWVDGNHVIDCNDQQFSTTNTCTTPSVTCFYDQDRDQRGVEPAMNFADRTTCPDFWAPNVGDCAPGDPTKFEGCTTCTVPNPNDCWAGNGDCRVEGDYVCASGATSPTCNAVPRTPAANPNCAVPNGDANCNGVKDGDETYCRPMCMTTMLSCYANPNGDADCDGVPNKDEQECKNSCTNSDGGTIRQPVSQTVLTWCPKAVVVMFGPESEKTPNCPNCNEHRSTPGASVFEERIGANYVGYLRRQILCPADPSQGGNRGYWEGTLYDWASAGTSLNGTGLEVSFDPAGGPVQFYPLTNQVVVNPSGQANGEMMSADFAACYNL